MEIIPSIIAKDFSEVRSKLARLDGLVNWAELDIMDGVFVPEYTWPINPTEGRQAAEDLNDVGGKIKISAHLMVEYPETITDDWQDLVDRLVIHYESTNNIDKIIEEAGPHIGLAIALELHTPVEKIYEYLGKIKTVQLMSIEKIGYSGEEFNESVFEKIKTLKTNWPDVKIIVDGGVNLENGKRLAEAGVSGLVVGSQIWRAEDIEKTIKEFQSL
jgi:ribulose-phosphate 3-epimerase